MDYYLSKFFIIFGDWGWGLGIGDWGLGPIPYPQSPIPILFKTFYKKIKLKIISNYYLINKNNKKN
jgi:hypothetical protein